MYGYNKEDMEAEVAGLLAKLAEQTGQSISLEVEREFRRQYIVKKISLIPNVGQGRATELVNFFLDDTSSSMFDDLMHEVSTK